MSKKILKTASFGLIGGKKKAAETPADTASAAWKPVIAPLSAEETRKRRLARKPTFGASTSIMGSVTSNTLGG